MLAECSGDFETTEMEKELHVSEEKRAHPNLWTGRTWGWKTVKSYFMLPVFHEMFGDRLKFIQVTD